MPSSVRVGSRPPSSCLIFSNSSGVRPCSRIVSGVTAGIAEVVIGEALLSHLHRLFACGFCAGRTLLFAAFDIAPDARNQEQQQNQDQRQDQKQRTKSVRSTHPSILSQMKSVIVGTAGHIDHGKTALVKALTGIDADRLEEEKRRGITIDIGF